MRSFTIACCLLGVAHGFGFTNYQIPQKTTQRVRWLPPTATNLGGTGSRLIAGCTSRASCESLDQVDPNWLFAAKNSFQPLQSTVLIAFDEVDFYNQDYTGVVVATGPLSTASNTAALTEGTRVYFSRACATKWTSASWTAMYGSAKAASMHGRLMNGVDLNNGNSWGASTVDQQVNGNGWSAGAAPSVNTYTAGGHGFPSNTFQTTAANARVTNFDDYLWGSGRAGDAFWGNTNNADRRNEDTPLENPNQQANYLLCTEAQILGVVSEESFANVGSHYMKASTVFEQSKQPWTYASTNRVLRTGSVVNSQFYSPERSNAAAATGGFPLP